MKSVLVDSRLDSLASHKAHIDALLLRISLWAQDIEQPKGAFRRVEKENPGIAKATALVLADIENMVEELPEELLAPLNEEYVISPNAHPPQPSEPEGKIGGR